MSAHTIVETVRAVARGEVERRPNASIGVVTSVFGGPDAHACTVKLRESGIVLPKVPIAVGALGFASLPQVQDLVLVVFANGDLHAPVVVGCLYDDHVAPPEQAEREVIACFPEGSTDASSAPVHIAVKTPDGGPNAVTIAVNSQKIQITFDDDKITLAADEVKLELDSAGTATLEAGDSSIVLKKDGNVTVQAGKKLSLKATEIEIKADAKVTVSGQTIDLN